MAITLISRIAGRGESTPARHLCHNLLLLRSPALNRLGSCMHMRIPHSGTHQQVCHVSAHGTAQNVVSGILDPWNSVLVQRCWLQHPKLFLGVHCVEREPVTLNTLKKGHKYLLSRALCTRSPDEQPLERTPGLKGFEDEHRGMELAFTKVFQNAAKLTTSFLIRFMKILLAVSLSFFLAIAVAPWLLSSQRGLEAAVFLTNKTIPGHAKVQSLSLGWKKPVIMEGISLKGVDGDDVLTISRLETKASLWSLVRGKAGLGNCTISSLTIDLQEEKSSGLSKLALAVVPPRKLQKSRHRVKITSGYAKKKIEPAVDVMLSASIRAPNGGLEVIDGKVCLPIDIACVLGQKIYLDTFLGHMATIECEELKESSKAKLDAFPLKVGMWSDFTQTEVLGFFNLRKMEVELIKPIKVEMDLSPEVGQLYLARINPLLGEIVGPAVQDEDMPDIVMYAIPENLVLPTQLYKVRVEPMKAILARGPLAGGILSLLSRGKHDIAQGRKEVTLQTSAIEANVHLDGSLECSRIDFLIAEKIHVATWGVADWIDETTKMTLAIPSTTLMNVLGLSNLSKNYHLQIPIGGTFQQPQVDWKSAAIGVAQLTLQQRNGSFFKKLLSQFESSEESAPEPIDILPWASV